jgi:hypothetical protein
MMMSLADAFRRHWLMAFRHVLLHTVRRTDLFVGKVCSIGGTVLNLIAFFRRLRILATRLR